MFAPTRWLLELYPIDEILASELKVDVKKIRFEKMPIGSPAYEVVATASGGARIAAPDVRAEGRRARRSSIDSRITSACASRPDGSRRTSPGGPVATSG